MVVVADAGMLSAVHLIALDDFMFSTSSLPSNRAPEPNSSELEAHFQADGNYLADDQTFEVTRPMGTGKDRRDRRQVW